MSFLLSIISPINGLLLRVFFVVSGVQIAYCAIIGTQLSMVVLSVTSIYGIYRVSRLILNYIDYLLRLLWVWLTVLWRSQSSSFVSTLNFRILFKTERNNWWLAFLSLSLCSNHNWFDVCVGSRKRTCIRIKHARMLSNGYVIEQIEFEEVAALAAPIRRQTSTKLFYICRQ